jgi:hypothetical protein
MLEEIKLGLARYWKWTMAGPKWQKAVGFGAPIFVLLVILGSIGGGDKDKKSGPAAPQEAKAQLQPAAPPAQGQPAAVTVPPTAIPAQAALAATATPVPPPPAATATPLPPPPSPTPRPPEPTATPRPPPPPPQPSGSTFGSGTKIVGSDIQPGTYRTRSASSGCYWERLSGFGGTLDEILENDNTSGPTVVTITQGDKGFNSSRCGTWTRDLSAITPSQVASFKGDGTYIVGVDIAAGTWRSDNAGSCYWARLSAFGGGVNTIIANNNGVSVVTIRPGDKGFESSRCGTWTRIE